MKRFPFLLIGTLVLSACRTATPAAPIARGPGLLDHHVHLLGPGLLRDWKSLGVPFTRPDEVYLTADGLFEVDESDPRLVLEGAILVPMAHLYGNEEFRGALDLSPEDEYARVRAENEHVARQAARRPQRTRALVSVDLLRPYALDEIERMCRESPFKDVVTGVKVHLASAGFRFEDPTHVAALERIAAWVEREHLWLLVHLDPQRRGLETSGVQRLLDHAFGPHPDLALVIAHAGGSGGFGPWTQSVLVTIAEWLASEAAAGRPRPRVHVDLSTVPLTHESEGLAPSTEEEITALAPIVRRLGIERVLFASDYPVFDPREQARFLRARCGFTEDELARIFRQSIE